MHCSYFVLRHLGAELHSLLEGSRLVSCYSQEKDELILQFVKHDQEYFIHTVQRPDFSIIRVPLELRRAKKNSISLFQQVENCRVSGVSCLQNERCISIRLEPGWELIIKMFGGRSNVILFEDQQAKVLFKQKHLKDFQLNPQDMNRPFEVGKQTLNQQNGAFTTMLPTMGGAVKKHLEEQNYWELNNCQQWEMVEKVLEQLKQPDFYIYQERSKPMLSMFIQDEYLFHFRSASEALNQYYKLFVQYKRLSTLKKDSSTLLERKIKNIRNTIKKSEERLDQLQHKIGYRQIADLIMANMHQIPLGKSEIILPDFHTGNPVRIKLKTSLSPQKNAESFYRKAKNQQKEVDILKDTLRTGSVRLQAFQNHLAVIKDMVDPRLLKNYLKEHQLTVSKSPVDTPQSLFKEFHLHGYQILIGRNASNNDLLTQKYSHKEDLWLHAKDVKGSHVVIKHVSGQNFPAHVIERAAQLAAYYSKRKHDSLCPVIYTKKKYVRKPKGAVAGQVVVDREQVMLVTPGG